MGNLDSMEDVLKKLNSEEQIPLDVLRVFVVEGNYLKEEKLDLRDVFGGAPDRRVYLPACYTGSLAVGYCIDETIRIFGSHSEEDVFYGNGSGAVIKILANGRRDDLICGAGGRKVDLIYGAGEFVSVRQLVGGEDVPYRDDNISEQGIDYISRRERYEILTHPITKVKYVNRATVAGVTEKINKANADRVETRAKRIGEFEGIVEEHLAKMPEEENRIDALLAKYPVKDITKNDLGQ